jgi:hypothetical protein
MIRSSLPPDAVSIAATYFAAGLVFYVRSTLLCWKLTNFPQIAALSIYRIYFHPLARYPGPLSYKLSAWPLLWQAYQGDRHIWHLKDHEKYGIAHNF